MDGSGGYLDSAACFQQSQKSSRSSDSYSTGISESRLLYFLYTIDLYLTDLILE